LSGGAVFNVQNDPEELENIRKEIAVMSQIFHPNVVLFMGAATDPRVKETTKKEEAKMLKVIFFLVCF
jgi:hypothetical protein